MTQLKTQVPRVFLPLTKPARYKGAWGGRGSGKSHFFAEQMVLASAFNADRSVCIREIQKSLDNSAKLLIEDKIRKFGLQGYFNITKTAIEGRKKDSLIIFQGMQNHTADSIKSLENFKRAWVEEAHTLSQNSLDLLRPTIRSEDSELWFSWNPRFKTDPIDALLRSKEPPPGSVVVKANYYNNPFLPQVLREEMEYDRRRDNDKYLHIWEGGYQKSSEARVFRNWSIDEFDTPSNAEFYFGGDWGFSIDPTVLIRCFVVGNTLYVDYEAYKVGCQIERTPALFKTIEGSQEWPLTADSARPETIDYMQRNGFPRIKGAAKGANSVKDGIEFLKNYDIVVHPRCIHTIDELTHYSFKIDKKTNEILPVLEDKKNHVIDALRYAVENMRRSNFTLRNVE